MSGVLAVQCRRVAGVGQRALCVCQVLCIQCCLPRGLASGPMCGVPALSVNVPWSLIAVSISSAWYQPLACSSRSAGADERVHCSWMNMPVEVHCLRCMKGKQCATVARCVGDRRKVGRRASWTPRAAGQYGFGAPFSVDVSDASVCGAAVGSLAQ
jgi:hypothetical protein